MPDQYSCSGKYCHMEETFLQVTFENKFYYYVAVNYFQCNIHADAGEGDFRAG